mgnify:CR=1 FL=1
MDHFYFRSVCVGDVTGDFFMSGSILSSRYSTFKARIVALRTARSGTMLGAVPPSVMMAPMIWRSVRVFS